MPSRPVQISLDQDLLKRIDRDEEARRSGRSTLIRRAVEHYLEAKRRRATDLALRKAYGAQPLEPEVVELIAAQAWPEDE